MNLEITTNHKTAYKIKKCFESKGLSIEKSKGMKLINISVDERFAVVYIDCTRINKSSDIFFLGMNAEAQQVDIKFDTYGNLPLNEANELLGEKELSR